MKRRTSTPDAEPQITREVQDLTEQIRQRANELAEHRGPADGRELDNWLLAESQLIQKREAMDSEDLRSPDPSTRTQRCNPLGGSQPGQDSDFKLAKLLPSLRDRCQCYSRLRPQRGDPHVLVPYC
ncbi:MAG TPA: DUF2934 domain-containing protein [Candidatus Bathyarchaeia archaeon]|nr:DUF2934 domain-containing protein [Candidatus Bathyarchaeia archaeon]